MEQCSQTATCEQKVGSFESPHSTLLYGTTMFERKASSIDNRLKQRIRETKLSLFYGSPVGHSEEREAIRAHSARRWDECIFHSTSTPPPPNTNTHTHTTDPRSLVGTTCHRKGTRGTPPSSQFFSFFLKVRALTLSLVVRRLSVHRLWSFCFVLHEERELLCSFLFVLHSFIQTLVWSFLFSKAECVCFWCNTKI